MSDPASVTTPVVESVDDRAPAAPGGMLARAARRSGRLLRLAGCLAVGATVCVYLALFRFARGRHHPAVPRLTRWWHGTVCRALGISVRRVGGRPESPALLLANHVSWLDVVVVGSLAPTAFVSKAEVARWPLVGFLATCGATLFIPRGGHQAQAIAQGIRERLAAGGSILIFPEGTTTDGSRLRPFFPRLLAGAVEAGARVQPVALSYPHPGGVHPTAPFVGDETFPRHLWRVLADPGIVAEVRFCAPLTADAAGRKGLARRCREAVAAALALPLDGAA
jgi:1-acyl-sn-glycerol-3-phosphate acyltransferase